MAREKSKMLSCRLDEAEFAILDAACNDLNISRSDYLRYMLHVPLAADGVEPPGRFIVLDTNTIEKMRKELVRWGYHYNQAVRSLNAIALYIRNGSFDEEWLVETLGRIEGKLSDVNEGRASLEAAIENLDGSTVLRKS